MCKNNLNSLCSGWQLIQFNSLNIPPQAERGERFSLDVRAANDLMDRGLVNMSATCSALGTYTVSSNFKATFSLMK